MVVPFIALLAIIILIVWFMAGAAKRNKKGEGLGETGRTES
jgi:hypothetical protein